MNKAASSSKTSFFSDQENDQKIQYLQEKIAYFEKQLNKNGEMTATETGLSREHLDYIATFNHELLTPMNAIIGMIELSLECEISEKVRSYLTMAYKACEQLKKVAHDAQQLSSISENQIILKEKTFDIHVLLENLILSHRDKFEKKSLNCRLKIAKDLPSQLIGDEKKIQLILSHLLDNAIKFSYQGEIILSIQCLFTQENTMTLICSVQDFGIGIPEQLQDKIFYSFVQANSESTRQHEGMGIGLSLCKKYIKQMKGEILVNSSPGNGSTFTFDLKLKINTDKKPDYLPKIILDDFPVLVIDFSNQFFVDELSVLMQDSPFIIDHINDAEDDLFKHDLPEKKYQLIIINYDTVHFTKKVLSFLEKNSPNIKTIVYLDNSTSIYPESLTIAKVLYKPATRPLLFKSIGNLLKTDKNNSVPVSYQSINDLDVNNTIQQELLEKLAQILIFLDKGDMNAEKLLKELIIQRDFKELSDVLEQISQFNFDEASEIIKSIQTHFHTQ